MKIFLDALSRVPTVSVGTQAFIISDMQVIDRKYPDCEFILLSASPEVEDSYLKKTGLKYTLIKRADSQFGTIKQFRKIVKSVDVVVSSWGDGYITIPPYKIFQKTLFMQSKTPMLLFTSSIGPFDCWWKNLLTKWGLRAFDYISVRDMITYEGLTKTLKLRNTEMVLDTAFVLQPSPESEVDQILVDSGLGSIKKFIGFNISVLMYYRFSKNNRDYVLEIIDLINWIKGTYKLPVLLIPHQIYPITYIYTQEQYTSVDGDDRYPIEKIWNTLSDHQDIYRITGNYNSMDLKGVIKRAEVFVGGRMHSVIAAISQSVPSLIMQYSHKAGGMMKLFNMEELVWDISESKDSFQKKFHGLWENRNSYRERLTNEMNKNFPAIFGLADEIGKRLIK